MALFALLSGIAIALTSPQGLAQQPAATPTPAPPNLGWCADVPASPPPPHYEAENRPGAWAAIRRRCINEVGVDSTCMYACQGARELWQRAKAGALNQPLTFPLSTDKPQGPFLQPDGGKIYILPLPPTPASSATPAGPESSAVPAAPNSPGPAPTGSFSGADLSATADAEPPDVAADTSAVQTVEFVNGGASISTHGGLYVFDKTGTQKKFTDPGTFWCGSNGVNGSPLIGCVNNAETLSLTDTQIGFDPALGLWIATNMAINADSTGNIYVAASQSIDATGNWEKWSEPVCTTDTSKPLPDQPLLGWSSAVVGIDVKCHDKTSLAGADNLVVIPNGTLYYALPTIPLPTSAPCYGMAPARDEQGSFSNLYLVASIVPISLNLPNCAPSSSNTEPYIVEYTASTSGVFGSGGCVAGSSGCLPVSLSPQNGNPGLYRLLPDAQQQIATADQTACAASTEACDITVGDARITGAQIRVSNVSGTNAPVLTTGFATGISASGQGVPLSQNLWFIQSLGSGTGPGLWLSELLFAGGDQWFAYPTIALDADQEFYLASTNFQTSIFPQTIWDSFTGLQSPAFLGQNVLESSGSTYIGQAGTSLPGGDGPQRWGDYDTMVFDPYAVAFGMEGVFWQIEEISKGGVDESTTWEPLVDPTPPPHFVSWNYAEQECNFSPGQTCTAKFPTPAGLQNGDVVVVFADMGGSFPTPPTPPPDKTWVELPIANLGNATSMVIGACNVGDLITAYAYAHVYGSSTETGTYDFKHVIEDFCNGQYRPEIEGFLVGYRGASSNLSSYVLYGYKDPNSIAQYALNIGPAPANSPGEGVLLNVFNGGN